MWLAHRGLPLDTPDLLDPYGMTASTGNPAAMRKGTPVKRKVRHSQSARTCDCFKDSPDKNVERNYILSFLQKKAKSQDDVHENKKKKKRSIKNKNESGSEKNKCEEFKNKKNALKRATSITLKRNRIIPLNDGSGGHVLVSQMTTIKETPCVDEEASKKEENQKNRFSGFLKRLTSIKRKARQYLMRKKDEKQEKDKVSEEPPKAFVEFETIPGQDDFIEENFEDEESVKDEVEDESVGRGRLSVCSSGYFTPVGDSPETFRRNCSTRGRSLSRAAESVEVVEEADGESVDSEVQAVPLESIRKTLDDAVTEDREELRRRLRAGEPLYPNCDNSIWFRTCEKEVLEPIRGVTSGMIPVWLKGTLLRNGPGGMKVGEMTFQHLFDSSSLLHRFAINNGEVTYQCRFLRSQTYLKNHAANRIVVSEFGTSAVPDPCQSIFKRVSALFDPGEALSDNAMISVYPFGDEFYCFTESPTIHRIDPVTLETLERVNVSRHVAVVNHTSHPHVTEDGSVFNQAMSVQATSPHYSIVKFPSQTDKSKDKRPHHMFENAEIVASVKARWPLHPSYMHTFGLTDRFYVIVEQPLSISVPTMVKNQVLGKPMISCLRFFKDKPTLIHLVDRASGKVHKTYVSEAFFYLHIINQFEKDNHLVVDICCYSDAGMLNCMYYDALKDMNKNPDYGRLFKGRPLRFVLPLAPPVADVSTNLVTLTGSSAAAWWRAGEIVVRPELLCNLGCETPRINYSSHLGKPYRYFYAISSDVDSENPGTLIKVDTHSRTSKTWGEPGVYPSEPVFVPSPQPQSEDDGVVVTALVWGQNRDKQVGLLVLDAVTWQELGRTVFQTPSQAPKCLHGWFTPDFV